MGFLLPFRRLKRRHSLAINRAISLILFTTCIVCLALLVLLFLIPESLGVRSLEYVTDGVITPSVAIGLLTTLLGGAVSPLLTIAVEHSFWLKLSARQVQQRLTVAECNRLAQWSVSVLHQLTYVLEGQSVLLRVASPLLFATGVIGPVLQAGVSPQLDVSTTTYTTARSVDQFAGFLDRSNSAYNGGNFQDNLMSAAALASMGGLKAPASSICSTSGCRIEAQGAALQASCQSREVTNADGLGTQSFLTTSRGSFCSELNPNVCVTLSRNDPATFANFTSSYPPGCGTEMGPDCRGEWSTILGAWVNAVDADFNSTLPINIVDCSVHFGNVTISQEGGASPSINRGSFIKSEQTEVELGAAENAWRRIYTSEGTQAPYSFSALQGGGSGANTLFKNTLALLLLNYAEPSTGSTAADVASTIEANFGMGTLFAFSRSPQSAILTISTDTTINRWRYDKAYLAILAIPVLAMILVLWGRCRVGDAEDVVAYKPIDIARRGPVAYMEDGEDETEDDVSGLDDETDEKTLVWGVKGDESGRLGRKGTVRIVTAGAF